MNMVNKKHYSFNLETLGTRYDSYILSIACAEFDIETGAIINTSHRKTVCGNGFNIDVDTVMWWLNQNDDARKEITTRDTKTSGGIKNEVPIETALHELSHFITDHKNAIVWGNGSSFDITLLDYAHSKCNLKQPWQYWNVRDMRTIVDLAASSGFMKGRIKFEGVKHDALSDAVHQAKVIHNAYMYSKFGVYGEM